MPGRRLQRKAEDMAADTHLALLGVKMQETAFWELKKEKESIPSEYSLTVYGQAYKGRKRGILMGSKVSNFGRTADGKEVSLVTMVNRNGMGIEVMNYGATLVAVTVPDRNGKTDDVLLGYEDVTDYITHGGYLGAVIGRNGNRIGEAKVTIDGKEYCLDDNENGNNLHSGFVGYDSVLWDMEIPDGEQAVKFTYHSKDGEQGFPGNFDITVTYTLTDENEVKIHYCGESDQDTIANLTNHSYFNLGGHGSGEVLEQTMWIDSDAITVTDAASIPTGEIRDIQGTPMDFNTAKKIGRDIEADYDQLKLACGYDHNYVLKNQGIGVRKIAEACDGKSGRVMEVFTDCAGVQFYTGNFIDQDSIGKGGAVYQPRHGFCLETQFYPDANHHENFPSSILKAGEKYDTTTIYKFSTK